jgi:heme-degrading monooxygenase HmoA
MQLPGFDRARILRRPAEHEEEFVTHTTFESFQAVRAFAADYFETPVIEPEAERLLSRYERLAVHYETIVVSG